MTSVGDPNDRHVLDPIFSSATCRLYAPMCLGDGVVLIAIHRD
jgi:hypothetical protein